MAKAPTPKQGGHEAAAAEKAAEAQVMTLVITRPIHTSKGRVVPERHTIGINNIPMRERVICRKATGLPLSAFWAEDRIDIDSIMVLWWMARRLNGEASLTYDQAAGEWPLDLTADEFDIEVEDPDPEADDPEA